MVFSMADNIILALHKKPQTVFTLKEISLFFPEIPYDNLKSRMAYFAKTRAIKKLRKGIYAKDFYNTLELANKLYVPSYISLETVLLKAGIIFQYSSSITSVSYISRTLEVSGQVLIYRRIKETILLNNQGLEDIGGVHAATKERAFLDAVFLYRNFHFDNLRPLDWGVVLELKEIYNTSVFSKRVEDYYKIYEHDNH